uniref:Uncharacterized protein n=1 Tax=Schistocephalus solidus TaxID=70667 RepID=A0A0V0J9G4_SCHSO
MAPKEQQQQLWKLIGIPRHPSPLAMPEDDACHKSCCDVSACATRRLRACRPTWRGKEPFLLSLCFGGVGFSLPVHVRSLSLSHTHTHTCRRGKGGGVGRS